MDPNYWGPKAWFFLHSITANYPINPTSRDKNIYKSFFISLKDVLPCSVCQENYKKHLSMLDMLLTNHPLFHYHHYSVFTGVITS